MLASIVSRATMPNALAKLYSGQSIKQSIDWAKAELEGVSHRWPWKEATIESPAQVLALT